MSKWNKQKPEISQQFLQNEERRKLMILEAAKMRKQRERRQQQQRQQAKRKAQQALINHKKNKQEVYVKYLRNNMHDKYEQKRKQDLQKKPEVKSVSKWKRSSKEKDEVNALNLEVNCNHQTNSPKMVKKPKQNQKPNQKKNEAKEMKKHLLQQFELQWREDEESIEEMIGSQLLDSLDLDFDTLARGQQVNKNMKKAMRQQKIKKRQKIDESHNQIKQLIGYESVLISIDQRKNHFKRNNEEQQRNSKKQEKIAKKIQEQKGINQGQAFNLLKNKKEGKILNWAKQESQEADELFSNCSSKRGQKTLSELNQEIRRERIMKKTTVKVQNLQTIPEKESDNKNISSKKNIPPVRVPQLKRNSIDKKNSSTNNLKRQQSRQRNTFQQQKFKQKQLNKQNEGHVSRQKQQNKSTQERKNIIRMRNTVNRSKQINKNNDQLSQRSKKVKNNDDQFSQKSNRVCSRQDKQRSNSYKKMANMQNRQSKTQYNQMNVAKPELKQQKTCYISANRPQFSVATHNQQLEIDSFIRNDLIYLNQQQRQLQAQLRDLHINNKQKLKDIQHKYEIKTDYKYSKEIIYGEEQQQGQHQHQQNEDELEQSIQRIDSHLIRKQLKTRQRNQIMEVKEEQESSSSSVSFINPLSNPIELHKQVLQLAENISRFDNIDPKKVESGGYAEKNVKKWKKTQQANQKVGYGSVKNGNFNQNSYIEEVLSQSKNVSNCTQQDLSALSKPPQFQYSRKTKEDLRESFTEDNHAKIQVNQRLKNMLFDD